MNVADIYQGLADDLADVDGLRVVDHLAVQIQPPAVFPDAAVIQYSDTFDGNATLTIPLVVLASTADRRSGMAELHVLVPLVGDAISTTLGGAAQTTDVLRAERYGDLYEVGGLQFIGATLILEVMV